MGIRGGMSKNLKGIREESMARKQQGDALNLEGILGGCEGVKFVGVC